MSSLTPDKMVGPMKLPSSYPATDTARPSRSNVTPAFSEASKILRMRCSASLLMMGPVHAFLLPSVLLVSRFFSSDFFSSEICSSRQISSREKCACVPCRQFFSSDFFSSVAFYLYAVVVVGSLLSLLAFLYKGTDTDAAGGAGCRIKTWPTKQIPISPTKMT
jgi:hypothetical protein